MAGAGVYSGCVTRWTCLEMHPRRKKYADSVEDTNGVYVVPAFTGLGAPYWNPVCERNDCGF